MKKHLFFKSLLVLVGVLITSLTTQVWGYGSSAGTVVYFDRQDHTNLFTSGPYLRLGGDNWNEVKTMSQVSGTKYLYSYELGQYEYSRFYIANGTGWGDNTVDQPMWNQYHDGNNQSGYYGSMIITQQTNSYAANIEGNYYFKLGNANGSLSYNCQYYAFSHGSLPSYSVTCSKTGNGTLTVTRCTGDENTDGDYETFTSGDDDFLPTQIIKIVTTPDLGYRVTLSVSNATSLGSGKYYVTGNCTISATFESQWCIRGSMSNDDWATRYDLGNATGSMRSGTIDLSAGSYSFKVYNRDSEGSPYGCSTTINKSEYEYNFYTNVSDACGLTITQAGTYHFNWDADNKQLTVIYPDLADKKILAKNTILYFDARNANTTGWKNADFTARFWFKYYDSGLDHGSVDCTKSNALGVAWMYYATVPNHDYIGRVQMNRINPSNSSDIWCSAYIDYAYERTNGDENCLSIPSDKADKCGDFRPEWTYYCPPMSSATLTHDGTNTRTYGGNGGSSNPYLVATSSKIYVSASSTSALADNQMTPYYQFKKEGVNNGDEASATTHTYTASGTNNTKEEMTVVARNKYSSTYGEASGASNSIYYEARTPYSVTPTLSHVTKTAGATGTAATVYGAVYEATFARATGYDLPATITVTNGGSPLTVTTDYTWNSSTGALQIKANKITGDVAISITGVAKTTSLTLDPNKDNHGTGSNVAVTATFAEALPSFSAAVGATGYELEGYYTTASGDGEKIINSNGSLVRNTTYSTDEETPKWNSEVSSLTLHARYTLINYNVTYNTPTNGDYTINVASAGASSASKTATMGQTVALVATPDAGYALQSWTITNTDASSDVTSTLLPDDASKDASTSFTMPTYNVSITATFHVRYALYGSLDNNDPGNEYGMPGWGTAKDFTYDAVNSKYTVTVNLTKPNSNYKFRVLDHRDNTSWGYSTENHFVAENTATVLSGNFDVKMATAGRGTYTLTVVENGSPTHPQVTISNPTSKLVSLGIRTETEDGAIEEAVGGSITVSDAASDGNMYTNGQYIAQGETVYITATPNEGYRFAGWWGSDAYTGDPIWGNTSVNWEVSTENVNAYAKFVEDANVFTAASSNNWSNTGNWSKSHVPTLHEVAIIEKPVVVDIDDARAKRVIIYNNGDSKTGKLTVNAAQELVVAQTVRKTTNGSNRITTTAEDLILESSSSGNGALVWGTENDSPGAAQVNFYSISGGKKNDYGSINQFIGTPFNNGAGDWLYHYYNSWVLKVDYNTGSPTFVLMESGDAMNPFEGYCVIYSGSAGHTYDMTGTLVSNADVTCSELHNSNSSGAGNMSNENLLANSWIAPIKINAMQTSDFTNANATIYIFNSTSQTALGGEGKHVGVGNYDTYPVNTDNDDAIIPSMQSFSVFTTASGGSVKLDYDRMVYNPAIEGTVPAANKAPRRTRVESNEANKVRLYITTEGEYGDMLYMWEHENFNEGFENGWDGRKLFGETVAPQLYAVTPDGNMAVNCVPTFEGTVMGFKAGTADNTYTFSFEYNNEDDALYLYDMDENKYTRVLEGNTYTFSTTDKVEHNRFILTRKAPQSPTGIENSYQDGVKAVKFLEDDKLFILRGGKLYNATGALVK